LRKTITVTAAPAKRENLEGSLGVKEKLDSLFPKGEARNPNVCQEKNQERKGGLLTRIPGWQANLIAIASPKEEG